MQSIEINSIKVIFDKEKTQKNITLYNEPCDCQYCKNYYKNVEANEVIRGFLSQFGIDYLRCEEVVSYDLGEDKESLIHSMAYYDVFGKIEKDFSIQKEDYTISFQANANVNVGHKGEEYFWIVIDAVMPYILDEEWKYICDSNGALPAMWEPHSDGWCGSRFGNIDDLVDSLIYEPEYKQFF